MLEGHVERYTATSIIGWARDADSPAEPEYVDIRFDGERIATLRADLPRPDLDGRRCGFEFLLPAALRHGIKRPLISVQGHAVLPCRHEPPLQSVGGCNSR
jgi:hypothetical protein